MSAKAKLADYVHAMDDRLPRPMTVKRQQMIYWPSILVQARRAEMSGSVFVNGFPSSGTNWLCQLVARYFSVPIFEPWRRLTPSLRAHVFHLHRFVDTPAARQRTLYIARDGRDAVVSRYHKLSTNQTDARPLRAFEAATGLVHDPREIREQLPAFIAWYFAETRFSAANWAKHVGRADELGLIRLTFEDLKADAVGTLDGVFARLSGKPTDLDRLSDVVAQMDFAKVRTQASAHHKRRSQVGEWREAFSPKARAVFAHHAQEALEAMGYEPDRAWVDQGDGPEGAR